MIIGALAAIAIPSFLNQTNKAIDVSATEPAQSAQIAAETYATDHDGSYSGLTLAALPAYDATIQVSTSATDAYVVSVANANSTGYAITTSGANGSETFTVTRTNGAISRTCTPSSGVHGGCTDGTW